MYGKYQFSKKLILAAAVGLVALAPFHALAANKLIVEDSTGTTDKFVVTDQGWIGVGHNAPVVGIHVKGTDANNTNIISHFVGTTAGGGGNINLLHNNDPTTNNSLPQANDRLGNIMFGSYVTSTLRVAGGGISGYADGTWTSTSAPTFFSFQTAPAGQTGRIERMRITSGGNIGIGATAPTQKLEVNGGVRINTSATKPTCSATARGTLWFTKGAVGVADTMEVCVKQSDENYAWKPLF